MIVVDFAIVAYPGFTWRMVRLDGLILGAEGWNFDIRLTTGSNILLTCLEGCVAIL